MRNLKKMLASILVVAMLATVAATTAFGATSSLKKGDKTTIKNGSTYVATSKKTASWTMSKKQRKSAKTVTVAKTVKIKGKKLKVNLIAANAIKGAKKLKTIKILGDVKINKKAFKGVKKSRLAKIVVKVKKSAMSKAKFNKLKATLIKYGFKAKNIKRY